MQEGGLPVAGATPPTLIDTLFLIDVDVHMAMI